MIGNWTTEGTLRAAWRRVRRNKGGHGGDGQTLAQFSTGLDSRLRKLGRTLQDGSYRPGPLRRYTIAKRGGGTRPLAIPTVRDRVAQAACAVALDAVFDPAMSDASFAYRRGRSVEHAAGLVLTYRLRGYRWVVDADIQGFFDTIPHAILIDRLRPGVPCVQTLELIERWLKSFSTSGKGIAQGSPISPVLANIHLMDLDAAFDRKGARIVRYADDFLILCRTRLHAEDALKRAEDVLGGLGLSLNSEKTAVRNITSGVEFLGFAFRGPEVTRDGR